MARWAVAAAALALGCGGGLAIGRLARPDEGTRTVTRTTVAVVDGSRPAGRRPAPLPTLLEGAADPRRLVLADAVPADASLDGARYVLRPPRRLVVTWERAHLTRNGCCATWQRRGVAVWQLDRGAAATWHRVYTVEVPIDNTIGIEGFDVALGDASGDARPEILIFFDTDGSAGGGSYHLLAGDPLREVFVRRLSADEGTISFGRHALIVRRGVDRDGGGIHCCFRKVRETRLRWNGRRLVVVSRVVRPNRRRWPPG